MSDNIDLLYETKKKMLAKYPRFGSEVAASPVVFTNDVNTGATDGKNIYLNPEYFMGANEDTRLYLLAHETSHKKFKHIIVSIYICDTDYFWFCKYSKFIQIIIYFCFTF